MFDQKINHFLLLLILVFLYACGSQQESSSTGGTGAETAAEELPDQESWESTITITREGKLMAEVWAGHIANYSKKNRTVLKDSVHVDFYNREGKHNSVLTSQEGLVDNKTRNLTAIGNVVVVSDSGVVLETEKLMWDNQQQKIISDVAVKFTTLTDTLLGDSFISDPDLANYEIRNARGYSKRTINMEK